MFEFKKSKSSDKVLTEKEIQQKLYGRYLNNKNAVAGASEGYSRPAQRSAAAVQAAPALFPESQADQPAATRPSELVSEPRPAEKAPEKKDLFTEHAEKQTLRDKFQASESQSLRSVYKTKTVKPAQQTPVRPNIQLPKLPWKAILNGLTAAAAAFFRVFFNIFFALGRVVDFRKEGVRTGLAWGSGVVLLVLLLAAVHGLNSKREQAMKSAVPKAPKAVQAKKTAAPSEAPKAALPAAESTPTPLSPAESESAAEPAVEKPKASKGRFVIQVATYVIRDDANRLLEDMKKTESRSFVKGLSRSSGKTYYSVFIGRFENYQEAQTALAQFKKTDISRSFKDAFIRTLES